MRTRLAAALLLTVFLPAAGSALLAKDPEWVEGRSEHFHVVGNAKPQKVEEAARKLEEFRHVFASMFSRLRLDPPVPTTVIFFKDDKSFRAYKPLTPEGKPANVAGFFQPGHERMYLAVNVSAPNSQQTAFHEYVHLVMELNFDEVPVWLEEGLAEFYDSAEIKGKQVKLGAAHFDYWERLKRSSLIPLDVLVEVDQQSEYYHDPRKQALFYGQSWLLVHYLMVADKGQRQKQFAQFIHLLLQAVPQQEAFTKAFSVDYPGMLRELQNYLHRLGVEFYTGSLREAYEGQPLVLEPLEQPVAEAYLSDLWINSGRVEEAAEALRQLSQSGAEQPEVLYRLGRIALEQDNFAEAEEHFQRALAVRPDDIGLRYYAAWAVSLGRLSAAVGPEERRAAGAQIIEYLSPVVAAKTDFLDAFDLLIRARLAHEDAPAELIPVVEQARQLMPQRHEFGLLLATLYLNEQRWDEAEEILNTIVRGSPRADQRQQAEDLLERLRSAREWQRTVTEAQSFREQPAEETVARWETAGPAPRPATEPQAPPPATSPVIPQKVAYLRGILVNVACSGDAAVITVETSEEGGKPGGTVHLAVRSRADVILMDPTDSGQKLECGASGVPVGINYRVQSDAPSISGVVMSVEFFPLDDR